MNKNFLLGLGVLAVFASFSYASAAFEAQPLSGVESKSRTTLSSVVSIGHGASPYTMSTEDMLLVDTSGGDVTIDLPDVASNAGLTYIIKKSSSDANLITIDPQGSQTVDGALSFTLSGENESIEIVSNTSEWKIVEFVPTAVYTTLSDPFALSTAGYASGEYAQMSNNSLTLPPGKWVLSGIVIYTTGSATTSLMSGGYFEANGNNTTTQPTHLGSAVTVLSGPVNTASMEMNGNVGSLVMALPTATMSNSTTTTIYGVARSIFSVAGTASLKVNITARRIL